MKSAYELAMERLGGQKQYSEELKAELAEVDRRYEAKEAEARLAAEDKLKGLARESGEARTVALNLKTELDRLARRREAEKDKLRRRER
jgi:hypothetical protein